MKYIRTKDAYGKEIIALFDDRPIEKGGNVLMFSQKNVILRNRIVIKRKDFDNSKQANTIEELCDAYVITSKQGHIYDTYGDYDYELKEVLPQAREECLDEDWDLYGCILVDGIIKQVAKFNDEKGELELLWTKN